jgi:hypothetical protein
VKGIAALDLVEKDPIAIYRFPVRLLRTGHSMLKSGARVNEVSGQEEV